MSHLSSDIAKGFILTAREIEMQDPVKKSELYPMKLIKLVYIDHGWYLALADTPWYITWNKNGGKFFYNIPISNDLIKNFYKGLILK